MKTSTVHVLGVLLPVLSACSSGSVAEVGPPNGVERLRATPLTTTTTVAPGTYALAVTVDKDAYLFVPDSVPQNAVPLVVMLHGAGGAEAPIEQVLLAAQQHHFAVLVPKSRQNTWDAALGSLGPDVAVIDQALQQTFKRIRVDASKIALAGFSDGASYALTLALPNGDLVSHVIAFSPGFISPVPRYGRPDIMIAHGTGDVVTSARNTRENMVPFLRALGYTVNHYEFDGGHQVYAAEADTAFRWFLGKGGSP